MPTPTIQITIRNQDEVVHEGSATAISGYNDIGPFDILPQHEHFVSVVKDILTIHQTQGEKKEIKITKGIMSVWEDKVFVYLDFSSSK